jgi:predicted class III extradiol MEMO1 family dioxygenase
MTYFLGVVSVHALFEVGGRVAHHYHAALHDVRQVDVVVVLGYDHASAGAADFLPQGHHFLYLI